MSAPFYTEWTFHVRTGVLAADLVDSTRLATHCGDRLAMRARNFLEEQAHGAGRKHGMIFTENTGDGRMMTFPAVADAVDAAHDLMRSLRERPAELAPVPLEIRAGIACGVILLDASGHRHGATINRAFRLMAVAAPAFVRVEGEPHASTIPDRGRLFLDEASVGELKPGDPRLRQVGVCRLKGFDGFHRVFELHEEAS